MGMIHTKMARTGMVRFETSTGMVLQREDEGDALGHAERWVLRNAIGCLVDADVSCNAIAVRNNIRFQ